MTLAFSDKQSPLLFIKFRRNCANGNKWSIWECSFRNKNFIKVISSMAFFDWRGKVSNFKILLDLKLLCFLNLYLSNISLRSECLKWKKTCQMSLGSTESPDVFQSHIRAAYILAHALLSIKFIKLCWTARLLDILLSILSVEAAIFLLKSDISL